MKQPIKNHIRNAIHFCALIIFQLVILRNASLVLGDQYGLFAFCYASVAIAVALTLMGLHGTLMKYLSICSSQGAWKKAIEVILRAALLRAIFIALVLAGLWVYLSKGHSELDSETIYYVCLFFVLQGFLVLQHAIFQGLQLYGKMALGSLCMFFGLLIIPHHLADLFKMLALGYGVSFLVNTLNLFAYIHNKKQSKDDIQQPLDFVHLLKFSLLLSIAALSVMIADHGPILLLKDRYSMETFSVLALAFNLALYPSRLNSFSEALVVPEMSGAWHREDKEKVYEHFRNWQRAIHLIGPVIIIPLILALGPFIRFVFSEALEPAYLFAALLILGNLSRFMVPAYMSILIASGHPGRFAICNAIKMAIDILLVLFIHPLGPTTLVIALVCSWVLYINGLCYLASQQLSQGFKIDLFITLVTIALIVLVAIPVPSILLGLVWLGMLFYLFKKRKECFSVCRLN